MITESWPFQGVTVSEWGGWQNAAMSRRRVSTLTEVAQRAGVSLTTASKAINGQNRVSEQTRARVLKAARELSFRPNPMARSLISGRSGTVGLIIVDSLSHRFVVPTMLGAEAALSEINLSMITSDARGDEARVGELAEMMRRRMVDGLIVVGDNNVLTPAISSQFDAPVVYIYGETGREQDVVHVPDDRNGGALALEHVLGLGRQRIAYLTGPRGTRAVVERVKGVRAGLRRHDRQLVAPISYGRWSQRDGRIAAERLLAEHPDVEGIICGSDQIASGVVDAVLASGRRIPEDVAVTGYDNWVTFAQETDPPLTTVDMNLEELGAAAVRDLFGIIDGSPVGGGVRLHPCRLVVRGSTDSSITDRNDSGEG
jgi:LacI family transcriptional regulator, galactose operon repressor